MLVATLRTNVGHDILVSVGLWWHIHRKKAQTCRVSSPSNAFDSHPTPPGGPPIQTRPVFSITYKLTFSGRPRAGSPYAEELGSATPEKTSFAIRDRRGLSCASKSPKSMRLQRQLCFREGHDSHVR